MYKLRHWIPIEKLDFKKLSLNPNAIHLLEKNMDKIDWEELSKNPNAIDLLEKNIDKIDDWYFLSQNPSIFTYDYPKMQKDFYDSYGKELIETLHHPKNFDKFGKHGWDLDE